MYLAQIVKELSTIKNTQKQYIPSLWLGQESLGPVLIDYVSFLSEAISPGVPATKKQQVAIPRSEAFLISIGTR